MIHPFADFEYSESGNYFQRELIRQEWDTIGEAVTVSFYRRSLAEISDVITANGLVISQISEGQVSEDIKEISAETYERLSTRPSFLFVKCRK